MFNEPMATRVVGGWCHNFKTILACQLLEHAACKLSTVVTLKRFWDSIFCELHFSLISSNGNLSSSRQPWGTMTVVHRTDAFTVFHCLEGISDGIMGSFCWELWYFWQVLHEFMRFSISLYMPGQLTQDLARSLFFSIPKCTLWICSQGLRF